MAWVTTEGMVTTLEIVAIRREAPVGAEPTENPQRLGGGGVLLLIKRALR